MCICISMNVHLQDSASVTMSNLVRPATVITLTIAWRVQLLQASFFNEQNIAGRGENWLSVKFIYCMYICKPCCKILGHPGLNCENELGGSATQQELRSWGLGGHNGMNRGTGGLNPPTPRQFEPCGHLLCCCPRLL